jgi:chemotaxis signal transduction protein
VSEAIVFLRVRSGARHYGLPLEHLAEVLEADAAFPVPAAQPALRGLMRVRDRLLPLVHLAAFVDGEAAPAAVGEVVVLIRAGERELCVEVDDAETVVSGELVGGRGDARAAWAIGVVRDGAGLVPVLDVPGLVARLMDSGVET